MTRTPRHPILIGLAVLFGLLLVPTGASAASCDWRNMLDAAANSRTISVHTTACYKRALAHLPADVDGYLPAARANIVRAMRRDARIVVLRAGGQPGRDLASVNDPAVAAALRGPVTNLLEDLGPAHVDQVPLPVLALGSVASLLLLAGLGTSLTRARTRRLTR
jgi:hypothetical protein